MNCICFFVKKVTAELGDELGEGDVNMIGFEMPSLESQRQRLAVERTTLEEIHFDRYDDIDWLDVINIITLMSKRIKTMREWQLEHERKKKGYIRECNRKGRLSG